MSEYFIEPGLLDQATPDQQRRYAELLKRKRALRSPLDYALYVTPQAKAHRHSQLISDLLVALVDWSLYRDGPGPRSIVVDVSDALPFGRHVHPETGEEALRKLMVSLPPQIGKSYIIGRHFPSWYLTKYPEHPLIYMSYAAHLAENYTADNKTNIELHPELGIALREDVASRKEFKIAGHEGGLLARGFGGIPTGKPAEGMITDDAFQDGEEAMKEERRNYVWNQYISGLRPRIHDNAWEVILNTRWNEDDLSGRFKEAEPNEWYDVNIPALAFDTADEDGFSIDPDTGKRDPLGRKPGEAICPEIASAPYYRKRQESDPFWFDAQYQGKPTGLSGNIFKDFSHYKRHVTASGECYYELFNGAQSEMVAETDCVRFLTADTALTDKQTSDWTVIGVWDLDPHRRLILRHVIRDRITGDMLDDRLREEFARWEARVLGIEQASVSYKLVQDMIAQGGIAVWPLPADKNKTVRAIPAANLLKQRKLFVDRDATWRTKYESELQKFPKDAHDDQVDMTSYAAVMRDLLRANPLPATVNPKASGFEGFLAALADQEQPQESDPRMVIGGP